jgi:hypothetical protein
MRILDMSGERLSTYFKLHRRYYRSVNLERDLNKVDALQGYIPTERSIDTLQRILSAIGSSDRHRAWTMTGVYGTGKSAFSHYLTALCASKKSKIYKEAVSISQKAFSTNSQEWSIISQEFPDRSLLRAVATGRREPLSWTIIRALSQGIEGFWGDNDRIKDRPDFRDLNDLSIEVDAGIARVSDAQVLKLLQEVVQAADTNVLLVIDELGKNLEFAAQNQGIADLYLLQQIAEKQFKGKNQVYFLGLLHQSFAGYSERLAAVEQGEWSKIQGRFEDIQFTDSPAQMTWLIGQAIECESTNNDVIAIIKSSSERWFSELKIALEEQEIAKNLIQKSYPLHPLSALVLPLLCTRYAQNDRSLFTFLTSDEPYGFQCFLANQTTDTDSIPTLKLHDLYDYFVEAVGSLASRINLQRWIEIQSLIQDARDQSPEVLKILKTIGILNLVTTTSSLRATPQIIALSLCDLPDKKEIKGWRNRINLLLEKGIVTYRRQLDELRIWEGSDFNVESELNERLQQERTPLSELLKQVYPLKPLVAQRHYARSGTLRYFEQRYVDTLSDLSKLTCSEPSHDGLILYWVDASVPSSLPSQTQEGKPLVIIRAFQIDLLRVRVQHLRALRRIQQDAPELQNDGVARREVRQRIVEAERLVDETIAQVFDWSQGETQCWVEGSLTAIKNAKEFQSLLSDICDKTYHQTPVLDNELINRRELTSQGAKARRELIEAMLDKADLPRLALEGYGPEVSMYYSVLEAAGIHRYEDNMWGFYPPIEASGLRNIWSAIEDFCLDAKQGQKSLDFLYQKLEKPPFGVKQGVVPILLAAVLLHHSDDVGVYRDGTFIPLLGPEHFELLVKDPSRFAVKYFEIVGLRSQVFKALEEVLKSPNSIAPSGLRNTTILMITKPLFGLVRKLPKYTLSTRRVSQEAQAIIHELQTAQEPDDLLFIALPQACNLPPIEANAVENEKTVKAFRKKLFQGLHEIQTAYDLLLTDCQKHFYEAFGVRSGEDRLREDLRVRAHYLVGQCIEPVLKRFVLAAADENLDDQEWIEALVMIVSDKPPKSWTDEDLTRFEVALSDLVRRFKNMEVLQKEVAARGNGFEASRITITQPDGEEVNTIVWVDEGDDRLINQLIQRVLEYPELKNNPRLQQAFVAKLSKKVLGDEASLSDGKAERSRVRRKRVGTV